MSEKEMALKQLAEATEARQSAKHARKDARAAKREAKETKEMAAAIAAEEAEKAAKAKAEAEKIAEDRRKERILQIRKKLDGTRYYCTCELGTGFHKLKCKIYGPQLQVYWPGADFLLTRDDLEWFKAQPGALPHRYQHRTANVCASRCPPGRVA